MNQHLWGRKLDGPQIKIDPALLETCSELVRDTDAYFDVFTDLNGVQHIRIVHSPDLGEGEIWETYSPEEKEFPLELFMDDTGDIKED